MPDVADWTVLLVDDEPDSLNLLHDILDLNGAHVYQAASGTQCLVWLDEIIPTVIVLDLSMPRPDGWDLMAEIRTKPRLASVPVVAVTAYYSERVASEAYQAGFDAFFPKPIKASGFLNKLKEIVG